MAGAGLGRLRRLSVFYASLVTEFTTFLSRRLAHRGLAVLIQFFLRKARCFFDFTLDAHRLLLKIAVVWMVTCPQPSGPTSGSFAEGVTVPAKIRRMAFRGTVSRIAEQYSVDACSR